MDFNAYLQSLRNEHAEQVAAEYRLGRLRLADGDTGRALLHARNGLVTAEKSGSDPVQVFFMQELFALIHDADGDRDSARRATKLMKPALDKMSPDNQVWTKQTWDTLSARFLP